MGRRVPPRVTYWTGTWAPEREAISKEIQSLRSLSRGRPVVVSMSSGQSGTVDLADRVLRLSHRGGLVLRALAPALERQGDVTHVFGSLDSWHLLRHVGRRPTIMTVVIGGDGRLSTLHRHVSTFVSESEPIAEMLRQSGVEPSRVRLVYPGVDLHAYRPIGQGRLAPFRILFASSPSDPAELDVRGVTLLVETARLCPEIEFVFLWRSWGDRDSAEQAFARLRPPSNVVIERRNGREMPAIYRSAHAISCLYAPGFGKSCPNSVVEALACGLPALVSDTSDIAALVVGAGAGLATPREPQEVAAAAHALRERHRTFSRAARELAECHFDIARFMAAYADLYRTAAAMPSGLRSLMHGRAALDIARR
jgi:glycosyltransferase involved in cell wall biosynthesis